MTMTMALQNMEVYYMYQLYYGLSVLEFCLCSNFDTKSVVTATSIC